ncbi:hypothetical protein [Bradyrhizobium sp. RP6]|uniref:hypothetical protein n=1 Tax=Bradyrhizobium sp. RP6 TaxID=2489596 RepID=UPI000F549FB2|nr:hypothetical protein [Bradyrhizobium sp. RP6]RQH12656.1 hypothetical protein EHH60_14285 [Bradyrhizobium sp. RP6]
MILIVGNSGDPHVVSVAKELSNLDAAFMIFDPFGSDGGISSSIAPGASVRVGRAQVPLGDFRSVWWRQKPRSVSARTAVDLYDDNFINKEWNYFANFLSAETTQMFSVNDRDRANYADNKITQLKIADEIGFKIPPTLISNNYEEICEFIDNNKGSRSVYKSFTPYMPPNGLMTYTTVIERKSLNKFRELVGSAPGIYQAYIPKDCEYRVTVVGEECFVVKILANTSAEAMVDWRRDVFSDMYTLGTIDPDVKDKILRMNRRLGLCFAAYDLIQGRNGEITFLELNPSGQWLWLEERLKLPVSYRLACLLAKRE